LLFTNFLIKNDAKEILTFKLNKFLKDIKYNCSKLTTKINKKELKFVNKKKNVR